MMKGHFICSTFIARIHSLRGAKYFRYFLLRFIVIFTQITQSLQIR